MLIKDPTQMKTVAVDLDGVLAQYDGWKGWDKIGDPIMGARQFLQKLSGLGLLIMIHTTRANPLDPITGEKRDGVGVVEKWLLAHDMPYDEIWQWPGKPIAVAYVDDNARRCEPGKSFVAFDVSLKQVTNSLEE